MTVRSAGSPSVGSPGVGPPRAGPLRRTTDARPEADTTHGTLVGRWEPEQWDPGQADGDPAVAVFHGVPYAAPPIGPRRFAAPQPAEPWRGSRDASTPGPAAPQPPSVLAGVLGAEDVATDEAGCLTLSVWTPGPDAARRPVVVWLHGGAFLGGRGSGPRQDAAHLARRGDAVVVSVTSRLGALGFLAIGDPLGGDPAAGDTGIRDAPVNRGLLDQAAALAWVRENAVAFGGDPDRILLAGHSSGALSALALAGSPASGPGVAGMFLASPRLADVATSADAAEHARLFGEHLGVGSDLDAVRAAPAERLVEASAALVRRLGSPPPALVIGTPSLPVEPVRAPAVAHLPVGVGTTRDEAHAFSLGSPDTSSRPPATPDDVRNLLAARVDDPASAYTHYAARRPGGRPDDLAADVLTDALFRVPILRWAAERPGPTRLHRFDWSAPGGLGPCHGADLPFLVGTPAAWDGAPVLGHADRAELAGLRDAAADLLHGASEGSRGGVRIDTVVERVDDLDQPVRAVWGIG